MKKLSILIILAGVFAFFTTNQAQTQADTTKSQVQHGKNFVDKNGDGYNDNAPDSDGDGIPNGVDPDYTGPKHQYGKKVFVDLNGDGIDDNTGQAKAKRGKGGYGPNKGTISPQSSQDNGSGTGSGTGTQNKNGRGKKWGKG